MAARLLFLALLLATTLPAQTRAGKDYAVFFYVTDFQPGIDDIRHTKTEAEAIAKELSDHYGFECAFVHECKKDDIANALDAWNKKLGPADQALFFFSMHGYYDPAGDRGYLIPADGKADAEHNYFRSWFSYDDLRTYLAPCRAGHILVALDACYSGSFGIRSTKTKPTQSATTQAPDCAERIRRVMQNKGRQFITSGKTDQETPKQSTFAGEILKTLRTGYDAEGLIFIDDLTYRLQKLKSPEPEQGSFVGHDDGLVFVPGGTFTMGCSSEQQDCERDEKPAHKVTTSDFYIGRYEVTQKLWTDMMGNNPSYFENCDNCPVEQVSWEYVQEFLKKLNQKYPGRNYRLPTEAEWEYAARGGGNTVLFGNGKNTADPKEINFDASAAYKKSYSIAGEYRQKTVPVGSLNSPNALGLHDMSGNVWEWCSDWYGSDYYQNSPAKDPAGPSSGSSRVLRGGSWNYYPLACRVAHRGSGAPGDRDYRIGVRLARTK